MRPYLTQKINFQRREIFGWNVDFAQVQPQTYWYVRIPKYQNTTSLPTDKAVYITTYIKGRIEVIEFMTGQAQPDKIPGSNTFDKEFLIAGNYKLTALEPSEWFCIFHGNNNNTLPNIEIINNQPGTMTVTSTRYCLVCSDTVRLDQTPLSYLDAVTIEPGQTLELAENDLIAFFDRPKL